MAATAAAPAQQAIARHGPSSFHALASNLLHGLVEEHEREVRAMYSELVVVRGELCRAAELMEGYIHREKHVLGLYDQLAQSHLQLTHDMCSQQMEAANLASQTAHSHQEKQKELVDPMLATESELNRIKQILAKPVVAPPDMQRHLRQEGSDSASSVAASPQNDMRRSFMSQGDPRQLDPRQLHNSAVDNAMFQNGSLPLQPGFVPMTPPGTRRPTPTRGRVDVISVPQLQLGPPGIGLHVGVSSTGPAGVINYNAMSGPLVPPGPPGPPFGVGFPPMQAPGIEAPMLQLPMQVGDGAPTPPPPWGPMQAFAPGQIWVPPRP